jgi:hypothetical protein
MDAHTLARNDAAEYREEFGNCCAMCTHRFGSILTRPATWILITGVRMIKKLAPGQRGQVCDIRSVAYCGSNSTR